MTKEQTMTAKIAREKAYNVHKQQHRNTIYLLKDQLDTAIKTAVNKGMTSAYITVSEDIDPELVAGLMAALRKLGYKVKLSSGQGAYGRGIVRMPITRLTLSW
jgi:biopolymer transport protein ExbD